MEGKSIFQPRGEAIQNGFPRTSDVIEVQQYGRHDP